MRLLAIVLVITGLAPTAGAQGPFDAATLASYRLGAETFERFRAASNAVGVVLRNDAQFRAAPLFSREVALSDDVVVAARGLDARLANHPQLSAALVNARISSAEFTAFSLALIAAHLVRQFVDAGVLKAVPPGVTSDNVAFVAGRPDEVVAVLAALRIAD